MQPIFVKVGVIGEPPKGVIIYEPNKKSRVHQVAAFSKQKDRRQLSLPTALKLSVEQV